MSKLWSKNTEMEFFISSRKFATPEQLFYVSNDKKYYAYWPKIYKGKKSTLQSRNSLIGNFTEKYSVDLLQEFASKHNWFAVQGVVSDKIGLSNQSAADVAICTNNNIVQNPEDILMIFEVKMSIVWNWELVKTETDEKLICLGDYKSHKGNPGLLRSDSMLKAIGKSLNIRISDFSASKIPIIILGNTPITGSYQKKVDFLKDSGIIQGFWSVNPKPLDNDGENIKTTEKGGFYRADNYDELESHLENLLVEPREFFSSMKSKKELGRIIEISNKEYDIEKKAQKFLELIRD